MRWVILSLALLAPVTALAGPRPALERQKEELRELRRYDREVRKVARRFDRYVRKDRDDDRRELVPAIDEIARVELVRLREQGISARVPPVRSQPKKLPPAEHPRRQELWDALVDLRDLADSERPRKLARASKLLDLVEERVGQRRDRAEERYRAAKSRG
jgi:hypothetical protein